ncbi:MAG: zf-TFIIB domain-containing protein [Candidatus Solibacter usitatus]|nr:zf-TFIIB domain-containing protein [Candidatus Solibacter usitatus]
MNCPGCGAAVRPDMEKEALCCDFCGRVELSEPDQDGVRDLAETSGRLCPVCRLGLVHASAAGIGVERCPNCRGILAPSDGFVAMIDLLRGRYDGPPEPPRPLPLEDLNRRIDCPGCSRPMDTHPYGGGGNIVIDNCPECDLNWLDHAELRRVVRAGGWAPAEEQEA